jgi:hypothetical protein
MSRNLNAKVVDLFMKEIYLSKKKELEKLRDRDQKKNSRNYSKRSWSLIFQTLEFVFNDRPIRIYGHNKSSKTKK